jgi:hypothetical protein
VAITVGVVACARIDINPHRSGNKSVTQTTRPKNV